MTVLSCCSSKCRRISVVLKNIIYLLNKVLVTPPDWAILTLCHMWHVESHKRNIFFFKHFFNGRTWKKIGSFIAKRWKKLLNSTTSIMVLTWTKPFKLTDKRFGDVLEISCQWQAHNLFAVGLNLGMEITGVVQNWPWCSGTASIPVLDLLPPHQPS